LRASSASSNLADAAERSAFKQQLGYRDSFTVSQLKHLGVTLNEQSKQRDMTPYTQANKPG
jgi:hypothetical protein